jgi:hypothetical protein
VDKQVKCCPIFVLICASLAVAEVNHGTVGVIYYTQDKIIMAADSRALFSGSTTPPDDTQCKVAAPYGEFLFVSAGLGGSVRIKASDPVPPWSNQDLARVAYGKLRGFPAANFVKSVAVKWTELELANLEIMYRYFPEHILKAADMGHGKIVDAMFGGREDGLLKLFLVQISFDKMQVPSMRVTIMDYFSCPEETGHFCVIGDSTIVLEFLKQTSKRARDEAGTWKPSPTVKARDRDIVRAMRLVELTIRYQTGIMVDGQTQKDIGGPIDAVEFGRTGSLRWYQKKKNCPAQ